MRNGRSSRLASSTNRRGNHLTLVVSVSCAFILGLKTANMWNLRTPISIISQASDDMSSEWSAASTSPNVVSTRLDNEDEADYIVRTSYQKSYAHILQCEDHAIEGRCISKSLKYFDQKNTPSIPWWFKTLLRDVNTNGAYGFWHHFTTTDPAINFCTIEKVGTTEWRGVFCDLNADECQAIDDNDTDESYPSHCIPAIPGKRCASQTKKEVPSEAPHVVFLRDPLERLLSGFIDKCVKETQRVHERHCEPNEVFNVDAAHGWGNKTVSPTIDLEKNPKQFFAAYLDIMPLKWNLHFVPQALYCDLYRKIDQYDFVGNMNTEFAVDLERMANMLGGRMSAQLDKSFGYSKAIEASQFNSTGKSNSNHATHAPEKVAMYYNAASVRKALELFSIDYVVLGLKVPEWAREMLRNEVA
ncbi:hypothetical protein ACHAXN_002762 [Cyclotella atomus]